MTAALLVCNGLPAAACFMLSGLAWREGEPLGVALLWTFGIGFGANAVAALSRVLS